MLPGRIRTGRFKLNYVKRLSGLSESCGYLKSGYIEKECIAADYADLTGEPKINNHQLLIIRRIRVISGQDLFVYA